MKEDKALNKVRILTGLLSVFYFLVPVFYQFITAKGYWAHPPDFMTKFFALGIFSPVLTQYDIALSKNSAIYYLAFFISLMLICTACFGIVFLMERTIYRMVKK